MIDTSKIIHAPVGGGRYTVTAPIVKEDYGLYLLIEGLELPSTYEVDFSNSEHNGTSVTMIGNSDGVLIPSQFISSGKDVFAFLYHVGADFGRTVYKFRIPNKLRPDRTNEEPTPEQQSVIDQAIAALNDAVEQTAQDVIDADASAQNASDDADMAEEARTDAQNYATQAEQSATDASQSASQASASATASAQSASQSAQIKADVEDLVDDAQGYANASAQSASASANSASRAQGYAQSASASAQSASGYASQADISANTASNKASEASTSAQTASNKASDASQSATNAQGYAQTAEQAKTASQTAQGLAESARDSAISAKNDAEDARDEAQNIVDGISAKAEQIDANTASIASLTKDKAPVITDTASGSIASFSDGADNLPLKSLVVDINPIQDLSHGDPSPENICPMSGWAGMQLNVNGTVIPISWQTEAGTVYGGKLDVLSGVLRVTKYAQDMNALTWRTRYTGTTHKALSTTLDYGYARADAMKIIAEKYPLNGTVTGIATLSNPDNYNVGLFAYSNTNSVIATSLYCVIDVDGEMPSGLVVYDITAPIEIQLTHTEVRSLLGQNNIFADTGDTEVEYRADTKLYISRLTEPDADMIADANIVSGQYFMVGNNLFKATANIASGASVIVGTNAIRKSLSEALNEINA